MFVQFREICKTSNLLFRETKKFALFVFLNFWRLYIFRFLISLHAYIKGNCRCEIPIDVDKRHREKEKPEYILAKNIYGDLRVPEQKTL